MSLYPKIKALPADLQKEKSKKDSQLVEGVNKELMATKKADKLRQKNDEKETFNQDVQKFMEHFDELEKRKKASFSQKRHDLANRHTEQRNAVDMKRKLQKETEKLTYQIIKDGDQGIEVGSDVISLRNYTTVRTEADERAIKKVLRHARSRGDHRAEKKMQRDPRKFHSNDIRQLDVEQQGAAQDHLLWGSANYLITP